MSNKIGELTQSIQERIQEIAYLMWESAGRQQGMAMEYWLSAEKEVLATMQAAAGAMSRTYQEEPTQNTPAETSTSSVKSTPEKPAAKAKTAKTDTATKAAARRTTTTRRTKAAS